MISVDVDTAAEFLAIDDARKAAYADLAAANKRGVTGSDLAAMLDAMDALDVRLERIHRAVWPRHKGRLIVALGTALLVSPTGRTRAVWTRTAGAA